MYDACKMDYTDTLKSSKKETGHLAVSPADKITFAFMHWNIENNKITINLSNENHDYSKIKSEEIYRMM